MNNISNLCFIPIFRVWFGEVAYDFWNRTVKEGNPITDIQRDLYIPGNLLVLSSGTILTLNPKTLIYHIIVDGLGGAVAAIQLNHTDVLVFDGWIHCVKHLSRLNNKTSPLIVKSESYGNIDGSFSEARFQFIRDAVKISDNEIAMTDSVCTCIRFINMQNESVNSKIDISYVGRALVVDKSGENLYFTAGSRLGVVNLSSNQVRILIFSYNNPQWA